MVAAAIYMTLPYVPTRWNPSDDPTRDVDLRPAYPGLDVSSWSDDEIYMLSELPKTRRWASLWIRMVLRLLGPSALWISDRSLFRQSLVKVPILSCPDNPLTFRSARPFDATLGYPGEGPLPHCLPCSSPPWIFFDFSLGFIAFSFASCLHLGFLTSLHSSLWQAIWAVGGVLCWVLRPLCWGPRRLVFLAVAYSLTSSAEAMPMFPKTAGEAQKAAARALRPPVPQGRPVLPATMAKREVLLNDFLRWAADSGLDMVDMLNRHHLFLDDINLVLERYGRELYAAGKSYAKYAETINAITSWKPAIRRSMQGAWDFGYSWVRHEPGQHHSAMPGAVAVAMLTTAIMWGWTRFAGCFAVMWAGLLRPGELLAATRGDLLLPSDGDRTLPFGLLAIRDPKTRYTAARHQTAKIDMADMLELTELFLSQLHPQASLWPMSGATLRSRFRSILEALQLPLQHWQGMRPLELASIRAGAATWILQTTESGDLLQRRGRWQNRKMMDIYVQEMTALIYLQRVPDSTRSRVLSIASSFPSVLHRARQFTLAKIPTSLWYKLFLQ